MAAVEKSFPGTGLQESKDTPVAEYDRKIERFKSLHLFIFFALMQIPFFAFFVYEFPQTRFLIPLLPVAAIPIAATYFIGRWTQSPTIGSNWIFTIGFIFFFLSSFKGGGLSSPTLVWSVLIPIMATLISGSRSGMIWLILVAAKFTFFFWYIQTGRGTMPPSFTESYRLVCAISLIGITTFSMILAWVTDHYRDQYLKKIQTAQINLEGALKNLRTLKGLLPICAWCKKVRNDKGYWDQIEDYFNTHSRLEFLDVLCPECSRKKRPA